MDKLFQERSNTNASFVTLPEASQLVCFTYRIPVSSDKSKSTNKIQVIFRVPCQFRCFFCRTLTTFKTKRFTHGVWVTSDKVKLTIKNQYTLHIENTGCSTKRNSKYFLLLKCYNRVLHEKSNFVAFSV